MHYGVTLTAIALFAIPCCEVLAKRAYYGQVLCADERYYCVHAKGGQTWKSLFKDPKKRAIVRRINRLNTNPYTGMRIGVPKYGNFKRMIDYAPFAKYYPTKGRQVIIYDPTLLAWGAYNELGELVRWGPGAGGKAYCRDVKRRCRTVVGNFAMYDKRGAGCISSKFPIPHGGAKMPHCMFFRGGYAFHGSPAVPGYHASHGCIRIYDEDARWMNREFIILKRKGRHPGTKVIVLPYGPLRVSL